MAYNVLDGTVDYSTTQHTELLDAQANQEIKGTKIIVGRLLSKEGREIVPPAITKIEGGVKHGILIYQHNGEASAERNLTFNGELLATTHVRAGIFEGSGEKLRNLPTTQFNGIISAKDLNLGLGLKNVRNRLQVNTHEGLLAEEEGLSVALAPKSGLTFKERRLAIEPKNCVPINGAGQNLSDDDLMLVHDTSCGQLRNTTLSNLYSSYIQHKIPRAGGTVNCVQIKSKNGFDASPNLTFDPVSNVLNIDGHVVADSLSVSGKTDFEGFVAKNIKNVSVAHYEVEGRDYTILCNTSEHKVKVTLPAACNNEGRILVVKKVHNNRFKLNSNLLTIDVEEGEIDFKSKIEVKHTYSAVTFQSDGTKWWVIGKTGS
jgi:hypothetical protein|tara:strand:+ start:4012 stop:5133 length:1122 start_codon:yes stop_codon:yes gene_type:complete